MPKSHTKKHERGESKTMKMKEASKEKMSKVMKEFKKGELNIGKSDKMVKNPKQAIAIGLSIVMPKKKK